MLALTPGKKLSKYVSNYTLFDLETTGTSTEFDSVVEISGVKVRNGEIVDEFTSLVNPQIPIPDVATDINGITDEMVAKYPTFEKVLAQFLIFAGDDILVGHNINNFDMKFLNRDAYKYWEKVVGNDYIDTLPLSRAFLPELSSHRLAALCDHYDISIEGAHRALADCKMNQQVFEKLAYEIEHPSEAAKAIKKCPKCGNVMKKRNGKFGEFWGCTGYPDCHWTENI